MKIKYIFAFDIEGTGESMHENFIVALGAALISMETGKSVETFKIYFINDGKWQPQCVTEFWEKHPRMYKNTLVEMQRGETRDSGMKKFKDWINTMKENHEPKRILIVSDTAGYDVGWLNKYLSTYDIENKPHSVEFLFGQYSPPLCTDNYYMATAGIIFLNKKFDAKYHDLFKALNVEGWPDHITKGDHDPLNDALEIGEQFAWVLKMLQKLKKESKI